MNNNYIYRHRRLDNNQIFYVGVGSTKNYKRAYYKHKRNVLWHNIVNKVGYKVEILADNLTREVAYELEEFLILMYGRRNLGLGTLTNMTDGGKGSIPDSNTRKKMSDAKSGISNYNSKLVIDTQTGVFYYSATEAAKTYNLDIRYLATMLEGRFTNKTNLMYVEDFEKGLPVSKFKKQVKENDVHNGFKHTVIDYNTKEIFESVAKAADKLDIPATTLMSYLKGINRNKTDFIFLTDYNKGLTPKSLNSKKDTGIGVIDLSTLTEYKNIKQAARILGIYYEGLTNKLKGNLKNDTTIIYLKDYKN